MIGCFRMERRKFRRVRINLNILYTVKGPGYVQDILGTKEYEAESLDLGEGGMAIKVGHYLPVGTVLTTRIVLSEWSGSGDVRFHEPLQMRGTIRSSVYLHDGEYRMGIAFQIITMRARNVLRDLVHSSLKRGPECQYTPQAA